MTERWRLGRHLEINVYGGTVPEWPEGRSICQCHNADDAQRIVDAVNSVTQLRSALAELVRLKDGPRDESYKEAKDAAWSHARFVLADPAPMYPGTRFLILCTLEGRRAGAVTVGESRLPVVDVLGLIRAHGVEEARLMWPQLTDDELAVLERLVGDLDAQEADDDG